MKVTYIVVCGDSALMYGVHVGAEDKKGKETNAITLSLSPSIVITLSSSLYYYSSHSLLLLFHFVTDDILLGLHITHRLFTVCSVFVGV